MKRTEQNSARRGFQYISCYSLSCSIVNLIDKLLKFQYISCYSLSFGLLYFYVRLYRFNTSHVTLYLFDNGNIRYLYEFQYISCYSLSIFLLEIQHNEQNVSIHLMLLFIHGNSLVYLSLIRFNTSHVTLYLRAFAKNPDRTACFNTSHVTLYLFL